MSTMNTNKQLNYMVKLAVLIAIILVLEVTGLGLLHFGTVEIAIFVVPVAVGAIVMGPSAGAVLGAIFGLMSLWECQGKSPFGTALFAINPLLTATLCIVPRILCGWLCGLVFKALKKIDQTRIVSHALSALSCALFNTIFFLVGVVLFFGQTDFITGLWNQFAPGAGVIAFMAALVGINALIEILSCGVVGAAIARALDRK